MKIQLGDKVICKLNNTEYEIIGATLSLDGTEYSDLQIEMKDKNNNKFKVDEAIFNEMFNYNWSNWIGNNIFLGSVSYQVLYRYNDKMFEMKRADNKGKTVTAKTHPDDKFDF